MFYPRFLSVNKMFRFSKSDGQIFCSFAALYKLCAPTPPPAVESASQSYILPWIHVVGGPISRDHL